MKPKAIHACRLPNREEKASVCLMDQEIPGTRVSCHVLPCDGEKIFPPCRGFARILFVCGGEAEFSSPSGRVSFPGRGVYIGKADESITVTARKPSQLLELWRWLDEEEFAQVLASKDLPYSLEYDQAHRYTEACKSPKTVSRMLVEARLIPRFAMGSVETYGTDRIEQHTHPLLEQFFFGLEENNCVALIDDVRFPFTGNMLLHIPLGSNHGVDLEERHSCHYLWMDFLLNEEALKYMDEAHTIIK